MSGDVTKATDYLDRLNPNWRQDPTYINSIQNEQQVAQQQGRVANPDAVTSEYAALKWLETNFPNYKQVVAEELDKLKDEIRQAAPHIVAESSGGQPPAPAA
jgi:alpha-L-fucosidase